MTENRPSYLRFYLVTSKNKKTKVWRVLSRVHADNLGTVEWLGRWRQYCFFPSSETVFNKGCLIEITSFLEKVKDVRN